MAKLIKAQFIVLLIGTLFAWTNFAIEMVNWLDARAHILGCVEPGTIPFLTPCFGGAIFFTIAFILSILIWEKSKSVTC